MQSENTRIQNNNGVCYLEYPMFDALPVRAATSTRLGGVTPDPFVGAMNLSLNPQKDDPANVRENYRLFCDATGFSMERIVPASQFHHDNIRIATAADGGSGIVRPLPYSDVDGLVTNEKRLALAVFGADCVPLLFADKKGRAVGACHCGWKGTYFGLAAKTVKTLKQQYGVLPDDLSIVMGPCIHLCCYEVSETLAQDFQSRFPGLPQHAIQENGDKPHLDLTAVNRYILEKAGVPASRIFISDLCTCCHKDELFSHRGYGGKRSVNANLIMLK